jgi:PiT family inorganic phosphate transporter
MEALVIFGIFLALLFDFLNGMNDAANSVATIVSTRVLTPRQAVLWAAVFNFLAAFLFGVHVANTMGKGIVDVEIVEVTLVLATLIGAIVWVYVCTHVGLPISVSHALVGGLIGSAVAKTGTFHHLIPSGILKVCLFIVVSPTVGLVLGYLIILAIYNVLRNARPGSVDRWFRRLQLLSAASYSLGHGANDAQKTMGIITVLLFSTGFLEKWFGFKEFHVPWAVIIGCHLVIALGTLVGGWRVIETLGVRMTKLRPVHGFAAESAAAVSLLFTAVFGIPVSTTHTITGAIIGVGASQRLSAVRWGVAFRIVMAWILTIPTTALVAGVFYFLLKALGVGAG